MFDLTSFLLGVGVVLTAGTARHAQRWANNRLRVVLSGPRQPLVEATMGNIGPGEFPGVTPPEPLSWVIWSPYDPDQDPVACITLAGRDCVRVAPYTAADGEPFTTTWVALLSHLAKESQVLGPKPAPPVLGQEDPGTSASSGK